MSNIRLTFVVFACGFSISTEAKAQNCPGWENSNASGPSAREGHGMAFDSARGVTVLFGGDDHHGLPDGTWEYDGTAWSLRENSIEIGPSPRVLPAMAYDSVRGVTVLFGGQGYNGRMHDTWEWDGTTWVFRGFGGPEARVGHNTVFDSARGVTVLFGGEGLTDNHLGDTWEWNGSVWSQRSVSGPGPASSAALAYDVSRGVVVLFGGTQEAQPGVSGQTWEWNGTAWSLRGMGGPTPRVGHVMAYDAGRDVTLLFGGFGPIGDGYGYLGDSWEWDGTNWTPLSGQPNPEPRWQSAMSFDGVRSAMVLFGGFGSFTITPGIPDTWEFACQASCAPPPTAELHTACGSTCYVPKNRYLSVIAPPSPLGAGGVALRVTFDGPASPNCPNAEQLAGLQGLSMWVGSEVIGNGGVHTGVFRLESAPVFRDWSNLPGGVLQVSDCNIVPCATYSISATSDLSCDATAPAAYSAPLLLGTTSAWGDVVGSNSGQPPNGMSNAIDVAAVVDCLKGLTGAPPKAWCDLVPDNVTHQMNLVINATDVAAAVDAVKGRPYSLPGPTAPQACP